MNATSTPSLPYDAKRLRELAHLLIGTISEFAQAGWTPATSSNFSHRLDEHHVAITVSGRDKRCLREEDIIAVDLTATPLDIHILLGRDVVTYPTVPALS